MSKLMLSAGLLLSLCACSGIPQTVVLTDRPPPPPAWVMQMCPPWPAMGGEGRVSLDLLAASIRAAKVSHAECAARAEGLQGYVRDVVRPQ